MSSVFFNSQTYRMLANPAMEMWQFGPMGIFDMWESEKVTGTPRFRPKTERMRSCQPVSLKIGLFRGLRKAS